MAYLDFFLYIQLRRMQLLPPWHQYNNLAQCLVSFKLPLMSSIANRHVSSIDLQEKDPIFLKKHVLSNQNEVCNDCGFPKNIGTKMILFFVVFVVGFGIYFGIYFGIDMLIIVLLNFLVNMFFLVPTCSGDFILVATKILHSCIFVKLHNC